MDMKRQVWLQHLRPWNGPPFPREFGLHRAMLINDLEYVAAMEHKWNRENCYSSVYTSKQISEHIVDTLFIEGKDWEIPFGLSAMKQMQEEAQSVVAQFETGGITPRVLFSGSRGFHFYIDFNSVKIRYLRPVAVSLIKTCKIPLSKLDMHVVGNMRAMARIPCSINERTSHYCIPVDIHAPAKEILKRSLMCRPYKISYGPNKDLDIILKEEDELAAERQYTEDYQEHAQIDTKVFPPCIIEIIAKINEAGYAGHSERIHMAAYLRQLGWAPEKTMSFFRVSSDFSMQSAVYHINYIYKKQAKCYGCRKAAEEGFCAMPDKQFQCPFYPSINVKQFGTQNGNTITEEVS